MYDHPGQHAANDALWRAIAAALRDSGIDAPETLDRSRSVEDIWRDPHLLFAQACGYPLVTMPDLTLQVVAAPIYDVADGGSGEHRSVVVVRADDAGDGIAAFRGRIAAVNGRNSNTGYNLLRALVVPHARDGRFFTAVVETGAHHASAAAVRDGSADIAAIDAVTFATWQRYEPDLAAALRIVTTTAPSPTLPFVTAAGTPPAVVAALRAALGQAVADPALSSARAALLLAGIHDAIFADYTPLRTLAEQARASCYPELR
ncbi:phosphate ABC transporter substrate-binding protein [Sphingomonas sp. Leaf10]|nr:phosphate ABC transporter substrate-binding protein [Sphingomonas sp. Leaf10]